MQRERKELIQALDMLVFALFVYVWYLDGATIWLTIKAALQVQFCNPVQMHPTWPLPFFVVFIAFFNLIVILLHIFNGPIGAAKSQTILMDFIGQQHEPSKIHVVFTDLLTAFVQIVMLVVAYEHGRDELKPEETKSALDESDDERDLEPSGQGWEPRDEEARLFAPEPSSQEVDLRTSLTNPVAVVRLQPLLNEILHGRFEPLSPNPDNQAAPSRPNPEIATQARPDTSRIRRFSRRPPPPQSTAPQPQPPSNTSGGDWPPMWLVVARNLTAGGSGGGNRIASGWQSLRNLADRRYTRVPTNQE